MSKQIFDSPTILEEDLIDLSEATRCFPVKISRASLERYLRRGKRGTRLESILIAGKRYTSREAIDRFIRRQLYVEPACAEPAKTAMSKKAIAAACERYGLPKPLGKECSE